jgi:hypothetical protein
MTQHDMIEGMVDPAFSAFVHNCEFSGILILEVGNFIGSLSLFVHGDFFN